MSQSRFPIAVRVEEEIAAYRGQSGNGFQGIMGELFSGFAAFSDPMLMASVSPPYDFSVSQLCSSNQAYQFYMMPPAEFVAAWSPVIKALFVACMIYKSRSPQAPQQTWILDECAQLGNFPLVTKLFTYGAGIGIRPWAVFQSTYQMKSLGDDAANIIISSAALRSYFAVRDIETASAISRMIGVQTLMYEDEHRQLEIRNAKRGAMQAFLMGDDPLRAGLDYVQQSRAADIPNRQQRFLRTPDEILNTPSDKQYIFTDSLPKPLYADRKPYYEQDFMSGRYHPNPYHL
jgi:type IV secretion system protein VirD4